MPDHDVLTGDGGTSRRRLPWAVFVVWTAFVVYTMDIFRPSESPWIKAVGDWSVGRGIGESLPSQAYHVLAFVLWGALLASASAGSSGRLTRRRLLVCAVATLLFASTTECLQSLNPCRSARVSHAVLNIVGGSLGLVVWPALPWVETRLATLWRRRNGAEIE